MQRYKKVLTMKRNHFKQTQEMCSIRKALGYFISSVYGRHVSSLFIFRFYMQASQCGGTFEEDKDKATSTTNHWPWAAESSLVKPRSFSSGMHCFTESFKKSNSYHSFISLCQNLVVT